MILAQLGQPAPWAKPFRNQNPQKSDKESAVLKRSVAIPVPNKPIAKSLLAESLSDRIPPMNLLIAYAMF